MNRRSFLKALLGAPVVAAMLPQLLAQAEAAAAPIADALPEAPAEGDYLLSFWYRRAGDIHWLRHESRMSEEAAMATALRTNRDGIALGSIMRATLGLPAAEVMSMGMLGEGPYGAPVFRSIDGDGDMLELSAVQLCLDWRARREYIGTGSSVYLNRDAPPMNYVANSAALTDDQLREASR